MKLCCSLAHFPLCSYLSHARTQTHVCYVRILFWFFSIFNFSIRFCSPCLQFMHIKVSIKLWNTSFMHTFLSNWMELSTKNSSNNNDKKKTPKPTSNWTWRERLHTLEWEKKNENYSTSQRFKTVFFFWFGKEMLFWRTWKENMQSKFQ